MKFHSALVVAAALMVASGCSCSGCASTLENGGSGGGKGNNGQSDGGSGGGDGQGGGNGSGDGGDGVTTNTFGPGSFDLDGGSNGGASSGEGVKLDPNGYIVLNQNDVQLYFMWIANNAVGTVSKYDTRTGKEVGRYFSHFPTDGAGNANGFNPADSSYGHSPSRTAIDLYGDMWVANRAPGLQGSVTKIANSLADCRDRNGNGQIDTSKDLNNDGAIDPASEMIIPTDWTNPAQYDECVLFTQKIGTSGGDVGGRAIAISASVEGGAGSVWVGSYKDHQFYKLRAIDGALQPVNSSGAMAVTLGWGAYGATIDSQQRLWAVYPGAAWLALIDTNTGTLINDQIKPPAGFTATSSYGIGIDGKDRVWLPGMSSGAKAARYDHGPGVGAAIGTWTEFDFSAARSQTGSAYGRPRGIAADDKGFVWMSADYAGGGPAAQLMGFNQETGAIKPFQTASGPVDFIDATDANTGTSIGVALDGDGNPWVNNYSGNAMKVDRTTGAVQRTAQQSSGLYTYSDFTGYQLRKFTSPRGTYRHDFAGCGATTQWLSLEWTASAPGGTSVEVYIKVANTLAELNSQGIPRYGPLTTSPADLAAIGVPNAPYARVEFVLKSIDGQTTPALQSFSLKSSCSFN